MFVKIHRSYRNVVALCDTDLIGKKFEEGIRQLDLRENFYKDKKVTHAEAVQMIRFQVHEDATFNIVGKEAVSCAIEAGLIEKKDVHRVAGIPLILIL